MSAEITGVSRIKTGKDGEPFIELNKDLSKQLGWGDGDNLEWEIIGKMAVIRKIKHG